MKKKFIFFSVLLIALTQISSCGKSSQSNLSPQKLNPGNNEPIVTPTPTTLLTAAELAKKLKNKWSELKGQTYKKDTRLVRYLPQDVQMTYCFPDKNKEEIFSNYDPYQTGLELASVSKLFTSLWTLQAKSQNYVLVPNQYKTYFSYNLLNGNLYIKGSFDPFFGIDRLEDALNIIKGEMKRRGIGNIIPIQKIITYNFIQLPIFTNQTSFEMNVHESAQALALSPALAKNSIIKVSTYLKKINNSFFNDSNLDTLQVENHKVSVNEDPLKLTSANFINITSFQRPLNHLLIFLNTFSHNLGTDIFYQLLGGSESFVKFLSKYMPPQMEPIILNGKTDEFLQRGIDPDVPFAFYNGSGLPYSLSDDSKDINEISDIKPPNSVYAKSNDSESMEIEEKLFNNQFSAVSKARNKATCELIFQTLEGLSKHNFALSTGEDLLPINGTGTLKYSISNDIPQGTFIGKTGTLNNLMTLAGMIKTKYGEKPFFLSFFRNNLDANGNYRPDAFSGNTYKFVRSTVTTELIKILFEYYQKGDRFHPNPDLLAQLNVNDFLARSFTSVSVFQ